MFDILRNIGWLKNYTSSRPNCVFYILTIMDISEINCYAKAKLAVYHYSQLGDIQIITDILSKHQITPVGLGFALYIVCKNGMLQLVNLFKQYIEKTSANFLEATQMALSITAAACYSGNIELIEFLINNGAVLNDLCLDKICKIKDHIKKTNMIKWITDKIVVDDYETALINLMKINDVENTLYLLKIASVEKIKKIINNIARYAAYKNIYDVFDWLIDNFEIDNHTFVICAMHFLNSVNHDAFEKILSIKNLLADTDVVNFLADATYNKHGVYSFHYIYFKCGLKIDYLDYRIIRCCAETGNLQLMNELIKENKDVYNLDIETNEKWKSCLEHCFRSACCYNHIEVAKFLIGMDIDPNCDMEYNFKNEYLENDNGLILAAKNDNLEIAKWLLSFVQYSQETVTDAVYEAASNSKQGVCVEILFEKIGEINYKLIYPAAISNNINIAKLIYELRSDAIKNTDFEINDFFFLNSECAEYLHNTHSELSKQLVEKIISLSKIKKDFVKIFKYFNEYENIFKENDCAFTIYDTLLKMSLFESDKYLYEENIEQYNSFTDGLKKITLHALSDKITTQQIDKTDLENSLTTIVSKYQHWYNRYDTNWDSCYNTDFFNGNANYAEIVENIKILDFCNKHSLNIDYKKVFDDNLICGYFDLVKNKINIDYISEKVTEMFDKIWFKQLNKIKLCFDGLKIKHFPIFDYSNISMEKINFLLDYFDAKYFFEDLDNIKNMNHNNLILLLNICVLQCTIYKKLVKKLYQNNDYIYEYHEAKSIIDTIMVKTSNNKTILDMCLKYSILYQQTTFLDYLISIGASINSDMNVKNIRYATDSIEKLSWLKNKGFDIAKYSDDIVTSMIDWLNYETLVKLRELGCIIKTEVVIFWYCYYSDYDGKYEDFLSLTGIGDEDLLEICEICWEIVCCGREDRNAEFVEMLEKINFEYEAYLFFRYICFLNFDSVNNVDQTFLDTIKEKYPRVNFLIDNDRLTFNITNIKRAIH